MKRYIPTMCVAVLLAVAGCTVSDSNDIRTSGLFADFSATSDGQTTALVAILKVGGEFSNNRLTLTAGDSLTASNGSSQQAMIFQRGPLGGVQYVTGYSGDPAATQYTISLLRDNDTDAPDSNVTMPADFVVDPVNSQYSSNEDISFTWTPTVPLMNITVYGDCIQLLYYGNNANTTGFVLTAGSMQQNAISGSSQCEVTVQFDSVNNGVVDSNYGKGGKFRAIQRRTLTFLVQLPI